MGTEQRSTEWLRGRAALRAVMSRRGEGLDTSEVRLPHAHYSLTHSDSLAVAAAGDERGIGVDLEHFKPMRTQAARYFLTDPEHSWIDSLPDVVRSRELLRLWTVKEALFKADLRNAHRTLRDYRVPEPWAITGFASTPESVPQRYTTRRTASLPVGGFLSVAITRR